MADRIAPPAALASAVGAVTALGLLLLFRPPTRTDARALGALGWSVSAVAGASAALAPLLVSAYRYSDAPAGSIVVFVTTSLWGAAAMLAVVGSCWRMRRDWTPLAGVLLAAVAGAGVLANWERPSSFSPVVRFLDEQAMMLLAGVLWVAGLAALGWLARSRPVRAVVAGYAGGSLLTAAALVAGYGVTGTQLLSVGSYAVAAAFATASAVWLAARRRLGLVGPALLAAPVLISGLTFLEQATGMFGPRPLLAGPVLGASVLVALGIGAAVPLPAGRRPAAPSRADVLGRSLAVAALASAAVALAAPALRVTVHGMRSSGDAFDAVFAMRGFEALGAWLALAGGLLALAAFAGRRLPAVPALAALASSGAALTPLGGTPLHTWVSWIPPEVQQDYGTEYAYIVFERLPTPFLHLAAAATLVSILILARRLLPGSRPKAPAEGASTEVLP
ncbi:MAG: hypothetical protein IBX62_08920 [Coriobacteriia bacterium]|nr:hypothetical protein [Coriobacteriia bacterium]